MHNGKIIQKDDLIDCEIKDELIDRNFKLKFGIEGDEGGKVKNAEKLNTIEDIKDWLACTLAMSIQKYDSIYAYFEFNDKRERPLGSEFVTSRISKWKFYFISNCFDIDIDLLEKKLSKMKEFYDYSKFISTDESNCNSKSRQNPHHIFVKGKSHPNGTFATSSADKNLMVLQYCIKRRVNGDPEAILLRNKNDNIKRENYEEMKKVKVDELVSQLAEYPKGSVVTVDRFYGGLWVVQKLAAKGKYIN